MFVIVLPSFSFWVIPAFKPEWQSGDLQAYLTLLLIPDASLVFLFLLGYSILCYLFLLIAPQRFAEPFLIRFGIYSGVLLALQYSIILFVFLFDNQYIYLIFLLWLLPLYFPRFYRWLVKRWDARMVGYLLAISFVILIAVGFTIAREILFFVLVGFVIAGPFWCFLIATQAAIWLLQHHETGVTLLHGLGVTAWVTGYVAAWRYDILKMYEMYSVLPLVPPDCYIATAAARGHSGFVGSWNVQLAGGQSMRVNRQLQIFKCAELALMAVAPRFHKVLRRMYDWIGEPLARRIQSPFLADAAYLLLKPLEWTTGFILVSLFPELDSRSIYH
jgi:hypothetical protein